MIGCALSHRIARVGVTATNRKNGGETRHIGRGMACVRVFGILGITLRVDDAHDALWQPLLGDTQEGPFDDALDSICKLLPRTCDS